MFPLSTNLPPSPPSSSRPLQLPPHLQPAVPLQTLERIVPAQLHTHLQSNNLYEPLQSGLGHFTAPKLPLSKSSAISPPRQTPLPSTSCYYLTSAQPLIRSTIPSSLKGCVNRVLRALHLTGSPPTSPTTVRLALWPHIHPLSCHAGGPSGLSPQPPSFHLLPLPAWSHHPQPQRGLPLLR